VRRHERQPDERKTRIQPEHRGDTATEEEHIPDQGEDGFGHDALNLGDVVVHAREDLSGGDTGIEARRQPLQVSVQRQPHIEEHVGRDACVEQAHVRGHDETSDRRKREDFNDAIEFDDAQDHCSDSDGFGLSDRRRAVVDVDGRRCTALEPQGRGRRFGRTASLVGELSVGPA
jgi:hypothetical protein